MTVEKLKNQMWGGPFIAGPAAIIEEINASIDFDQKLYRQDIEARLSELIGPVAGRLHTARLRNDQEAVDFRLWVREALQRIAQALKGLIEPLLVRAEQHVDSFMLGFTHLQSAQPVTFAHYIMAYVEMFGRDLSRMRLSE